MRALLGLFICFVLVNTGTSLECEVCAVSGSNCFGNMETCENGEDTCMVILSDSSVDGYVTKSVVKACAFSKSCTNKTQYIDYGQISIRIGIACCLGDSCHTVFPELSKPLNDTQRNGKYCPACLSLFSSTCKADEMVECHGPQEECIDLEGMITYGPVVLKTVQKGCVSKVICEDLSLTETKISGIRSTVTKAACKAATPKPPPPHLQALNDDLTASAVSLGS